MTTLLPHQIVAFGERGMRARAGELWGNSRRKRALDVLGSLFGLVVFWPLAMICAGLMRFRREPGNGWLTREACVGKGAAPFWKVSLNTCGVHDCMLWLKFFVLRWELDRAPQFWNVLRGEMSLVGPEAGTSRDVERYRWEIPGFGVRHFVRPGITGQAQITGWGGKRNVRKRAVIDSAYVRQASLTQDLRVIFRTLVPARQAGGGSRLDG